MFDEYREMEEISKELHHYFQENREGIFENDVRYILGKAENLIDFGRMLNQPIHLNIYTDKNGNEFIQARSSILTDDGRIMANAYIGSPKVYKGGINDEEANMRGRKALYKKIRKYFIDE
jgi:hypothetical protein